MQVNRLNLSELSDILELSKITNSIDLGTVVIHTVLHPKHGSVVVASTTSGDGVMVRRAS